MLLHGTCVTLEARAALLRGPSGAGKSDLALCFLTAFRHNEVGLVADDQVRVAVEAGRLIARAPAVTAGRMEVRGVGIVDVRHKEAAELCLVVDLVPRSQVPRLPPDPAATLSILGVDVPAIRLSPFEASAPAKLWLALGGRL